MSKTQEFFDYASSYIPLILSSQKPLIIKTAQLMGDCINNDGVIQLFGINHGIAFSMELGHRAGGLVPFHQFRLSDLIMRGVITENEYNNQDLTKDTAIAHKLWNLYNILPTDMFILISMAANEPIIVETALKAKTLNHKIILVTNKNQANNSNILHPTGKKLTDLADITLDVLAPNPDLALKLSDGTGFNQVATINGNIIAQMLTAEVYRYFQENNWECPILLSANVKEADLHNKAICARYDGRWNS